MKDSDLQNRILLLFFLVVAVSGCVSSKKYETVLRELDDTHQSLNNARREVEATSQELAKTQQELNQTQLQLDSAQAQLMELEIRTQDLQHSLRESSLQVEMLREVEAETNRRNQIYAQFVDRLRHMIDGGQLTVNVEKGRVVIQLPNHILFESGSADLNPRGRGALTEIATVFSQFSDRRFQVEGHTDNQPISSARFPNNWALSAARALAVVYLLTEAGVPPENLSAAGFGEYQPRADNRTPEGRRLNRRIEIVMLPNLEVLSDEIPKLTQ